MVTLRLLLAKGAKLRHSSGSEERNVDYVEIL